MTTQTGNSGQLSFGGTNIAELKAWSLEQAAAQIPDTAMGDLAQTSKSGLPSATGSIEVHYDEADSVQESMDAGVSGVLILFPKGNTAGQPRITLSVQVTGRTTSGGIDEILPQSFTYAIESGAVVRDLVP
ncbi:hypothetical protein LCGC14_2512880 [marine sediment metagenome]|uniref:Uncharacterized protein n=1 Tax=marine sediment metagenome TaxID=412755 RepID=A0A0F9DAF5_9ZZZZ